MIWRYDKPMSAPPTNMERQRELNETIRIEFEFLKYIERVEEKAPDMVKDARIRWLNAICAGVEFFLKAPRVEQGELLERLVTRNTQMRPISSAPIERRWLCSGSRT